MVVVVVYQTNIFLCSHHLTVTLLQTMLENSVLIIMIQRTQRAEVKLSTVC